MYTSQQSMHFDVNHSNSIVSKLWFEIGSTLYVLFCLQTRKATKEILLIEGGRSLTIIRLHLTHFIRKRVHKLVSLESNISVHAFLPGITASQYCYKSFSESKRSHISLWSDKRPINCLFTFPLKWRLWIWIIWRLFLWTCNIYICSHMQAKIRVILWTSCSVSHVRIYLFALRFTSKLKYFWSTACKYLLYAKVQYS